MCSTQFISKFLKVFENGRFFILFLLIICITLSSDVSAAWWPLSSSSSSAVEDSLPVIIWWTPSVFPHFLDGDNGQGLVISCGRHSQCVSTMNRNYYKQQTGHGHSGVMTSILFYGTDLLVDDLPLSSKADSKVLWALLHEESPMNKYVLSHDGMIELFNFTSTFSRHSDYPLTSLFVPSVDYLVRRSPVPVRLKNRHRRTAALAPVLYVQSNCDVSSDRDAYVAKLAEFVPIDSFGKCLHNADLPPLAKGADKFRNDEFHDFIANYKFHLAFENAICEDYVTEKLFRALHVGSVPIYRGSPSVDRWTPGPKSIIKVDDFRTPEELARFVLELDADDEHYEEYLEFKSPDIGITNDELVSHLASRPWRVEDDGADEDDLKMDFVSGYECFLCQRMHEIQNDLNAGKKPTSKFANRSHMGCPAPTPSYLDNLTRSNVQEWIDIYWYGSKIANALQKMIRRRDHDSTRVHVYAVEADRIEL